LSIQPAGLGSEDTLEWTKDFIIAK